MNGRTIEIIEEVSSQGIWTWLEFDNNSDSLYLEFINFKLLENFSSNFNKYDGNLVIRFGNNLFLSIFYNDVNDLNFLNIKEDIFNNLFYLDKHFKDLKSPYFFTEFSKKLSKLKFQDYELFDEIIHKYKYNKTLVSSPKDIESLDFLFILDCDNVAISVGCDFIHTFNDAESLNDDDIKRLSNKWVLYYLDYWDKKGAVDAYDEDMLCEEIPFYK